MSLTRNQEQVIPKENSTLFKQATLSIKVLIKSNNKNGSSSLIPLVLSCEQLGRMKKALKPKKLGTNLERELS